MQRLSHWTDELLACDDGRLPDELFDRIVALGERAREKLVAFATAPEWRGSAADGGGWAPMHALEVLAELPPDGATAARLVESIVADPGAAEVSALVDCLAAMGAVATPALTGALAAADDEEVAAALGDALAEGEARGDDVFAVLMEAFGRFPGTVAASLAAFADARAIAPLRAQMSARFVGAGSRTRSDEDVAAMAQAIEDLGGELLPEETAKWDLALRRLENARRRERRSDDDASVAAEEPAARPRPNEPCPCGSGRKFKKCHEGDADFDPDAAGGGTDEP